MREISLKNKKTGATINLVRKSDVGTGFTPIDYSKPKANRPVLVKATALAKNIA